MRYPAQGPVTQGFTSTHQAVDIGGNAGQYFGTSIVAPHDGTITAVGQMGTGTNDAGLAIDVSGGRFKSRMAHNNQILVKVGQAVKEGQQIGTQGYTGYTIPAGKGGTHCHWVLWDNGVRVDGRKYISGTIGGDMIPDQDNFYGRYNKAMFLIRGRNMSREEFKKHFVGNTHLRMLEAMSDNPEADNYSALGQWAKANKTAVEKQIQDLQTALANEKNKPPKEIIKEVERIVEKEVIKEVPIAPGPDTIVIEKDSFWKKLKSWFDGILGS